MEGSVAWGGRHNGAPSRFLRELGHSDFYTADFPFLASTPIAQLPRLPCSPAAVQVSRGRHGKQKQCSYVAFVFFDSSLIEVHEFCRLRAALHAARGAHSFSALSHLSSPRASVLCASFSLWECHVSSNEWSVVVTYFLRWAGDLLRNGSNCICLAPQSQWTGGFRREIVQRARADICCGPLLCASST